MTAKLALFSSAIVAASLYAPAALAADAAATTTAATPGTEVEAIVVTARKREENLQRVPISVTAKTGVQLQQQNIREPLDLNKVVPSLSITSGQSSSTDAVFSIRGQTPSDILLTLSQPVGLYEDSVNIPHPAGTNLAFFDLSQIEVLNGPQGTLYGRNTTGGAINIITRGADYDGEHGFVSLEGGNYNDLKVGAGVNIPIIDDVLSIRLAGQYWKREGYGQSAITGEHLGGDHNDGTFRGSLRFDPTPNFSLTAKLEYDQANDTSGLYQLRAFAPAIPGLSPSGAANADAEFLTEGSIGGVPPSTLVANNHNLFLNYTAQNVFENVTAWHGVVDASWRISPDVTLRSITGVHQFTDFQDFSLPALPTDAFGVGYALGGLRYLDPAGADNRPLRPDEQSLQVTQEFDLSGSAVDHRLTWLVGGFYSNDDANEDEQASIFGASTGVENDFYAPSITNNTWAIFTQEDFKINDVFSITGGLRYTQENLRLVSDNYLYLLNSALVPFVGGAFRCSSGPLAGTFHPVESDCDLTQSLSDNGISYLASFNAQVTSDILLYFKTARGFRGGALQARAPDDAPAKPELATDYEIGMKSSWFDHRLQVNLAGYDTEYSNKQETQIVPDPVTMSPSTPILNAASARIQGIEGAIVAVPIEGLTLNANFDYLHGDYLKFPKALLPSGAIVDASGVSFSVPPWSFDLGGRYHFPVGEGDLALQADYSWHDATPQTELTIQPGLVATPGGQAIENSWYQAVGLLSARIEYTLPSKNVTFAVFSTNLLNKHYQLPGVAFVGPGENLGYSGVTQEPLMWGVQVRMRFGGE